MKQLTLRNLEAIAGGAGHYFTKTEDTIFGMHVYYPTAKGVKKFLDKTDHLAGITGSIVGLAAQKFGHGDDANARRASGDAFLAAAVGAGVGVVGHMILDDNIDDIYAHFGLKAE